MNINNFEKTIEIPGKRRGQIVVDNAIEEKLSAGFYYGTQLAHSSKNFLNEYFALLYLLKGNGNYIDHNGKKHHVSPGCLIIRHPGTLHSLERTTWNDWLEFSSAIPFSFYETMIKAKIVDPNISFITPGLSIELLNQIKSYLSSFSSEKRSTGYVYKEFLNLFLALLEAADDEHGDSQLNCIYDQAKVILSSSLEKRLSMPDIASKLGLGYENFRKRFTELTGYSPQKYRILKRLDKADILLSQTDMLIKEIAITLGYADTTDFIRQYKKFKNVSPEQSPGRRK